jgi:hypothetical protein
MKRNRARREIGLIPRGATMPATTIDDSSIPLPAQTRN